MLFVSSLCTIQSLLYSQDEPKLIACIRVWKKGGGVWGKSKDFYRITWFLGNGGEGGQSSLLEYKRGV